MYNTFCIVLGKKALFGLFVSPQTGTDTYIAFIFLQFAIHICWLLRCADWMFPLDNFTASQTLIN